MALICESPRFPDAWVHLFKGPDTSDTRRKPAQIAWVLTVGYAQPDDPLRVLESVGCHLPPSNRVLAWEQGIYARFALPDTVSSIEIAGIIERIMVGLHGITSSSDVELALESQQ
jgi:hypothetical protein